MHKHFTKLKVEKLPKAEAEITGEITLECIEECREEALNNLNKLTEIPGFRPGHIPNDVLVGKLGEMRILEEAAEIAIGREYPHIIEESKLTPIGRPRISITKLAPGIPLEFKARVYLEPEFDLPDYKKIAKEENAKAEEVKVDDKEVEDVVKELKERDIKADLKEGETLEDKVKENLKFEKEHLEKEKTRIRIVDAITKATEIDVPDPLVESELARMIAQFQDDVEKAGMKWEDYLVHLKKTEEDLKKEWREKALDRVKSELILVKIAEKEKIEPDEKEVEHEAEHLLSHYPDADPLRARIYVYTQMRNHKVFEFLENQK